MTDQPVPPALLEALNQAARETAARLNRGELEAWCTRHGARWPCGPCTGWVLIGQPSGDDVLVTVSIEPLQRERKAPQ